MSMSLNQLADQIQRKAQLVNMPTPLTRKDYMNFIIEGLRTLFGDTNRQSRFDTLYEQIQQSDNGDYDELNLTVNEQRYVLLTAQENIYKKMRSSVANLVGYTTNALSITNADKPYANYKDMINEVELERRRIFYKLVGGMHESQG